MKKSDYKHIRAWGMFMRSFEYYIRDQQELALQDNAPLDAIYKRDGKWRTYSEVENESTRFEMDRILGQL